MNFNPERGGREMPSFENFHGKGPEGRIEKMRNKNYPFNVAEAEIFMLANALKMPEKDIERLSPKMQKLVREAQERAQQEKQDLSYRMAA